MIQENKNKLEYIDISKQLSKELGIKEEVIYMCIRSEFEFIKNIIESTDFDSMDIDDLENVNCSFNLKRIGKISPTRERFIKWRNQREYLKNGRNKIKED